MTHSEIHAVMAGGFSTIAGSVMGAYISFGVRAQAAIRLVFPAQGSWCARTVLGMWAKKPHCGSPSINEVRAAPCPHTGLAKTPESFHSNQDKSHCTME